MLLRDLRTQFGLSQPQIARQLGRDQSWVSRRLSLIEDLPEQILKAVSQSKVSVWIATRILAPMARAIPEHATQLLNYLTRHHHSTREVQSFFDHYQKSNRQIRTKLINEPELFFKAQKANENNKKAKRLAAGPEGQWANDLNMITNILKRLEQLVPTLLYERIQDPESERLLKPFNNTTKQFELLTQTIRNTIDAKHT